MSVPIGELLQQLNAVGEGIRIEAKTAERIGRSVLETVCAFSNEPGLGGGFVVLGIAQPEDAPDLGDEYIVVGVGDADKLMADLASQCASAFNRPVRPVVWTEDLDGKRVVGVFVPEAQPRDKPLHFRGQGLPRGAFRRIGTTDQRCTEDDMLVFYQDEHYGAYDETTVPGADEGDIDPEAIGVYRRSRANADPDAEELRWSDAELLWALGCAGKEHGRLAPTVAGLLLFGTTGALRRHFPMMRVDYIRVPGQEWVTDPERRFDTVELRGPLMRLIGRISATILDDLPKAFSLPVGRIQRQDIPIIPDRVIREIVVNAVMHRSYRTHGAVQVIRYANRLEVRNPGHSLVAADQLGEPGSKTRNPKIAAVLHDTRFAETKGSGIRVMRQMMTDANLSPPTFESNRSRDEFVATLLLHHFLDADDMAWLARFHDYNLSNDEARALIFVRETGAIGNAPYRDLNRVDMLDARRHLRRLRDSGLLTQKGKGFDTYYVATDALLRPHPAGATGGEAPTPPSGVSVELPVELPVELSVELPAMPEELTTLLSGLGPHPPSTAVREVIRALCSWQALQPADIAKILGRNKRYIQEQYLRPLVRDGELEYTIPDRLVHPRQAYRAVQRATA